MALTGETIIPAPRTRVWQALTDPDILKQSIPDCESLDRHSDTAFAVTAARFSGRVTLSDLDPPNGFRLHGDELAGGAAVTLDDTPDGTRLRYTLEAPAEAAAKEFADTVLRTFNEVLSAEPPPAGAVPPPPAETASPATADEAKALDEAAEIVEEEAKALAPWLWIGGLLLILAGLLVAMVA